MPQQVTDIDVLRNYLGGVMDRADHHAQDVNEVALATATRPRVSACLAKRLSESPKEYRSKNMTINNLTLSSSFIMSIIVCSMILLTPSNVEAHSLCPSILDHLNPIKQCKHVHFKDARDYKYTEPRPSRGCPDTFNPAPFKGHTGRVAFFNDGSSPLTVTLYHPSNLRIYNRYQVPAGVNLFLGGNSIMVGDDWGICFEGWDGVVSNVGAVSIYHPNYNGGPLFMIQNNRLR